jgi:hypothetical protein
VSLLDSLLGRLDADIEPSAWSEPEAPLRSVFERVISANRIDDSLRRRVERLHESIPDTVDLRHCIRLSILREWGLCVVVFRRGNQLDRTEKRFIIAAQVIVGEPAVLALRMSAALVRTATREDIQNRVI